MSLADSDSRMISLEERIAFLEQNFEQLNSVVLEQQDQIQKLSQQLAENREFVRRLGDSLGDDLPHERPPHY